MKRVQLGSGNIESSLGEGIAKRKARELELQLMGYMLSEMIQYFIMGWCEVCWRMWRDLNIVFQKEFRDTTRLQRKAIKLFQM